MIIRHCDMCGKQIDNVNDYEKPFYGTMQSEYDSKLNMFFEIRTGISGVWDTGDFCKFCIIKAVFQSNKESIGE